MIYFILVHSYCKFFVRQIIEQRVKERNTVIDLNQVKMVPMNPIIPCSLYTFEVDEPEKVEGRSTEGRLALALAKMRVPS